MSKSKDDGLILYCEGCRRSKRAAEFYRSNNLTKYPDGYVTKCKDCLTLMVDNFDPSTFLWILEELDIPYIPDEWTNCLKTWGRDKSKLTGKTIIGRYISKMKLKQYKDFRWADTEYLQQINDNKIEQAMKRQGYSAQQIDEQIRSIHEELPIDGAAPPPSLEQLQEAQQQREAILDGTTFSQEEVESPNFYIDPLEEEENNSLDLTEEDKKYLRIKWGKSYKPLEWVQLEQLYNDMMNSYDIVSAGDINSLKIVCKASLKTNQLLDLGDKP